MKMEGILAIAAGANKGARLGSRAKAADDISQILGGQLDAPGRMGRQSRALLRRQAVAIGRVLPGPYHVHLRAASKHVVLPFWSNLLYLECCQVREEAGRAGRSRTTLVARGHPGCRLVLLHEDTRSFASET